MKTALIDADILPYEFGGMKELDEDGNRTDQVLPWEVVRSMVDDRIQGILEATDTSNSILYLTHSPSNFRLSEATILPYKGNRPDHKPEYWDRIREHLIENYDATVVRGYEADDALGIMQYDIMSGWSPKEDYIWDYSVICSRDKDLNMIPGWHYVWPAGKQKEQHWFQDQDSANRCFFKQLLVGDRSTDNILGIYGVGDKAKVVRELDEMTDFLDMFKHVRGVYKNYFGSYYDLFMHENGNLLWILTEKDTNQWSMMFDYYESLCVAEELEEALDGTV